MKKDRIYIVFLIFSMLIFIVSEYMKPKEVDWSEDYTRTRTIPYSTKILYDELDTLFPGKDILLNEENLYYFDFQENESNNWIFINSGFEFDQVETELILDNVHRGDHVFIAGLINGMLADTLDVSYRYHYNLFDSTLAMDSIKVSVNSSILQVQNQWVHDPEFTFNYFDSYDTSKTTVVGSWENNLVNFIRIEWGNGALYLNSNPKLFTNYYLREPEYARYAFTTLSHLPVRSTVWDAYDKNGRTGGGTPLNVILNTRYLRQAWLLAVISVVLFMIFKARRRQRIIPVISPPVNSTLEFTSTIGKLYLEQGNHKKILDKKVQFFMDYIKNHLRMDPTEIDEQFKINLSLRSGIPKAKIFKLLEVIEITQLSKKITDAQLKEVTDRIDQFYKESKR